MLWDLGSKNSLSGVDSFIIFLRTFQKEDDTSSKIGQHITGASSRDS